MAQSERHGADAEFIAFQDAIAGRYSLEREVGRGGMGIVYLARELSLSRPVAIKVLPRALAQSRPELRERFVREAQMAAQLSHPHVVPIHHVDAAGPFVFFVMTYVEGETLGERIRTRGPLSVREGTRVLREVAWALAYAHSRGIVHRDVKPDNILIERESGRAMVTDFGIAGAVETAATTPDGQVRGTVHFLSPEQAAGEPVDGRSDVYSLGVVGYFVLSGRLPFDGPTAAAVMVQHLSREAEPLARVAPTVPRRLAQAVDRCLEKRPADRWETGEAFADALGASSESSVEIPAPLRLWISQGERGSGAALAGPLAVLFLGVPLVALAPFLLPFAIVPAAFLALVGSDVRGVRELFRMGFTLDDIRSALQLHTMRRREELSFARSLGGTELSRTALGAISAASAAAMFLMLAVSRPASLPLELWVGVMALIGALGLGSLLGLSGMTVMRNTEHRSLDRRLRFWTGKWGARVARLAGLWLKPGVVRPALPQFTEVALGRATDALYESLPKTLRKQLGDVPAVVRRLESDASSLRSTLERIDEVRGATRDAELAAQRAALHQRLTNTVAALENIRLGLLRLQLGTIPATQVTAALDAARRVDREIEIVGEAAGEVRRVLGPSSDLAATPV